MSISSDELAGLSDEERAALDDGSDPDERDLLKALLEDEDDDGQDLDDEDDEPEEDEADDKVAPAEIPGAAVPEFHPVYQASPVADYAERMAQIAAANKEIATGYENGDFDLEEYQTRQRKLTELEWGLREANLKATLATEQQQQGLAQRWQWEQDRFFGMAEHKAYREDPVIGPAFGAAVQLLAADVANDARPMSWFLEEADRMTRARFRVSGAEEAAPRRGRSRPAVPPTLGGLPAAAIPETGADEFSKFDRLEGMALERALAKLTEAEADRYLMARSI